MPCCHGLISVFFCSHQNGTVHCEAISCPPPQCPAGTAPAYIKGACCKECQRKWGAPNFSTFPHFLESQTLLHTHKHTLSSTTTSAADLEHTQTPPPGLLNNWPGLCCVAKLPHNMSPEKTILLHIHEPINYSLVGLETQMATSHTHRSS